MSSRLDVKRLNFMDCATIPTRLLDEKTFPEVADLLKEAAAGNEAKAKEKFEALCKKLKVPGGPFTDYLWKTMLEVNSKVADTPGWIPGT